MTEKKTTRINKYLSEIGHCSRRAADKLIEAGRVTINGVVPEMGTKIVEGDAVHVDGNLVSARQRAKRVYLAFNKPIGIVCTTDTGVEPDNIIDFIGYPTRIFPIGRLDKPSEGLIFLTNDGDIVNKILRAKYGHEKEYIVSLKKPVTPEFIAKMQSGVPILDTVTSPCRVERVSKFVFRIVLTQGLNRQIRRMCKYFGITFADFLKEYPEVEVEVVCTDRVVDLVDGGFDVAIRLGPLADSTLIARKLGTVGGVLVASPKFLKKNRKIEAPNDLSKHECLIFAGASQGSWSLRNNKKVIEVKVRPRYRANDMEYLRQAAIAGLGVAMIPAYICAGDLANKTLKRVLPKWCSQEVQVSAVYPSARLQSPKLKVFLEHMQTHFSAAKG